MASKLDDGRVLLARSSEMQVLLPDNTIYTLNFFTEDEYLAYLLWRDEELVRRALAKRGIGWVLLRRPVEFWERDYNQWTMTAAGYPTRHYLCLPQSEGFSQVYEGEYVILYKVDEAWLRGGVSTSARSATDDRPEGAQSGDILGERPRASRDGSKTNLAVWRPSNSTWYVLGQAPVQWGSPGDIPVPGDYDGDGKTNLAVWRPSNSTWSWYIPGQSQAPVQWGLPGDIPVPGDYNGDGKTDLAVWRPSNGTWYIPGQAPVQWGSPGDIPVPGDYNRDGSKTDLAVWRTSNSVWYVRGQAPVQWGLPGGDIPVPGDYDGDGKTNLAVWRPSNSVWYVRGQAPVQWGLPGDIPVPGDYDGDGKTDMAVWRPPDGTWHVRGQTTVLWGLPGDIPVPGDYNEEECPGS